MVGAVVSTGTVQSGASVGLTFADSALESSVMAILKDVETVLIDSVDSANPLVTEAARHLVNAGGKRFRPLLVALAAHFGDPSSRDVVMAGAVVELTHLATLYHDDVMDEADVRRGAPSANSRWGNSLAILIGDYLFARAAACATELGLEAVKIQSSTFSRLVHGQVAETAGPMHGEDAISHYLRVISQKTGSLISTSARFGGMFGGCSEEEIEALATFAETFGIAFQLSDDLIDIASESTQSGKTPGTDLREGVPTLPVLYALASGDGDAASIRLREILSAGPVTDDALHAEALGLLRESAALKQARETVRGYADRARASLAPLPHVPARAALESLCDFIADRTN
ncbi:polyprenyl synthetase family protein [Dactylosporangium maewongense]